MVDLIYLNFFPSHFWPPLHDQFPPTGRWRFFQFFLLLAFGLLQLLPPTRQPLDMLLFPFWMMNLLLLAVIIIINDSMSESLLWHVCRRLILIQFTVYT